MSSFFIAEKNNALRGSASLLRWALVIIFLWFGGMKFTSYEANGIAPFIANSPVMNWLHALFGVQWASYLIGILELATAVMLIVGAFNAFASALGAAMSCITYVITLSFFLSTPGVAESMAGGFPAISAFPGQFLLKDVVLLAASASLLLASIRDSSKQTRPSLQSTARSKQWDHMLSDSRIPDRLSRAGTVRSIDRLEVERLVERRRHPGDRRASFT